MKIKHFYIALDSDDFKQGPGGIVSDFNFQSYYFSNYVQRMIKNKFESETFNFIFIRGKLFPKLNFIIDKDFKTFEIETFFDIDEYYKIYPCKNTYPLDYKLLKPIEKEEDFSLFLYKMLVSGVIKAKQQNALIPSDDFLKIFNEFKENDFKNEWVFKKKTFKDYNIIAELKCRLTCNYFSLWLQIYKNKVEIFNQEILRTLPDSIIYHTKFNDIIVENNILKITQKFSGFLFELPLSELNK